MAMYVQLDKTGHAVSMCSVRQNEADIELAEPSQDMYANLQKYQYTNGEFVKDEAYMPPEPPKSTLELLEDAVQELILTTVGGE